MKKCAEIEISKTRVRWFSNALNNVIYVMVNLLNLIIKLETIVIEEVIIEERRRQYVTSITIIIDIAP